MLNEDMKTIIKKANLAFVATENIDGSPNLSPKSTLRPWGQNHLIFANLASPGTVANVKRDPHIEINCIDFLSRRGYRFSGTATVYSPGDKIYEEFLEIMEKELGKGTKVHDAVLIKLSEIKAVLSPAYEKEGVTEKGLVKTYRRKYGVND